MHGKYYEEAIGQYSQNQWEKVVELTEKGVRAYITAEEECRLSCEKPFDMGWYPDFVASISSKQSKEIKRCLSNNPNIILDTKMVQEI